MDLSGLVKAHRQQDALATIALYTVDNPTECGIVELDDQGRVRRFMEKPAPDQVFSRLANAGIFVTEPEVLSDLPADRFIDFGHAVFPRLLASGHKLIGYPTTSTLIDIGTPQKYQKAQRLISEKAQTQSIMEFAR
jgi:mannose-1-phosphate guanylyltransferase